MQLSIRSVMRAVVAFYFCLVCQLLNISYALSLSSSQDSQPSQENVQLSVVQGQTFRLVASQNNCFSPCGVHFSVDFAEYSLGDLNPYFDVDYRWDFGDPGSQFSQLDSDFAFGRDANSALGPYGAHVYEKPGTYVARVSAIFTDGRQIESSILIKVSDPENIFHSAETFCVSFEKKFDDCPKGALRINSWAGVVDTVSKLDRSRVLFGASQDYILPPLTVELRKGKHVWGQFGHGARPRLLVNHSERVLNAYGVSALSISSIELKGSYSAVTGLGEAWQNNGFYFGADSEAARARNITFYNNVVSGVYTCFNPRGGVGHIFANNVCANWYNYGGFAADTQKLAFLGNVIRQAEGAHSGVGAKNNPSVLFDADEWSKGARVSLDAIGFSKNIANSDIAVFLLSNERGAKRKLLVEGVDYTFDAVQRFVLPLTSYSTNDRVLLTQRRWADHGPIRDATSNELVVSHNDMFSNNGWSSDGLGHQATIRYNTSGVAGHSGSITNNRLEGGFQVFAAGASRDFPANLGKGLLIENNHIIGTSATVIGLFVGYGNTAIRKNVIFQPKVDPIFNSYWYSIQLFRKPIDPVENYSSTITVVDNVIVNLSEDKLRAGGRRDYRDYVPVKNSLESMSKVEAKEPAFVNTLVSDNLVFAPLANDITLRALPSANLQRMNSMIDSLNEGSDLNLH